MKPRGIREKILFPIIVLMTVLSVFAILRVQFITQKIGRHYEETMVNREKEEFVDLIKDARSVDDFLRSYAPVLAAQGYEYRVSTGEKEVARSNGFVKEYEIRGNDIVFSRNDPGYWGFRYYHRPWNAEFILLRYFPQISAMKRELNANTSVFLFSVLLMILAVMIILRKNLIEPLRSIMHRIGRGECAVPTDVSELDELIDVINDALATAEMRHLQATTLHNIAVSLNEDQSLDELMERILEQSRILIHAELSAIALYDESGNFSHLRVYGLDREEARKRIGRLPSGEGILKLMKFSMVPVRINDLQAHPAYSGRFPDGHPEIRNFLGYPIFSRDGRPLGALYFANKHTGGFTEEDEEVLMAIASDVAVAIQRISETRDLERFKQIIESAFDVIVVTDPEGNITYVNHAFQEITGYHPGDVIGENPRILKSGLHDDSFYRELWETITSGRPWKGEFINKKKDGELYNASAVIFPLFDEAGKVQNYISIQRDITEEKKLYEQLLRAQKMEAIGTLAGGIAHDFNNILSAILGYSEILMDKIPDDEKLKKAVDIIGKSARRGASLAGKILSVTRKEKLELKVVELNRIVEETLELLRRSIPRDIEIRVSLEKDLPPVKVDPVQIQQVVMNLAINARDAMPNGGVLAIETSSVGRENGAANGIQDKNGFLKLSISDTGKGISRDMQSKIFDPFFTTKEQGKGTGLGLYIVHSVVTNHGGYINLYSEPDRGTRFNIYLPAYKGEIEEDPVPSIEELKGDGTVLVIDDEEDLRELVKDFLEPLGYRVLLASDGKEGLKVFRKMRERIDLVILDMIMPGMNGAEVFQQMRSLVPGVKVLLCSGYSHEGLAGIKELIQGGAAGFIQKPFSRLTIARQVRDAILP